MLLRKRAHLRVDSLHPPVELGDSLLILRDISFNWPGVKGGDLRGEQVHSRFKLLQSLALGGEQTDRQVPYSFRDVFTQDSKRAFALRCNEYTAASCEIVAYDVCDRVSFPGARRSLHDDSLDTGTLEAFHDSDLFLIERLRKKELTNLFWLRRDLIMWT